MHIRKLIRFNDGWRRFDLNVGGFSIHGCRWYEPSRQILFPRRYSRQGRCYDVIRVSGRRVLTLRALLESDQEATPRDRRPCTLRVHFVGRIRHEWGWNVFNFTVRGFTILGCRWTPEKRSIQLPVTFDRDNNDQEIKRLVVRAYGAHINRLRDALEEAYGYGPDQENAEELEAAVPAGVDDWN